MVASDFAETGMTMIRFHKSTSIAPVDNSWGTANYNSATSDRRCSRSETQLLSPLVTPATGKNTARFLIDDIESHDQGHLTQTWLAVSGSPNATRSGQVWHHRRQTPSPPQLAISAFKTNSSRNWPR